MSITLEKKKSLISEFKINEKDTGSSNIQIAILTERINNLTEHMKLNKKDNSTKQGLLKMVAKRKTLLSYVKSQNEAEYNKLIQDLNLRK